MATPEHGEKIIDPIHQFVINRIIPLDIGGVDISFTNSALWAVIAMVCASLLFILAPRNLIPTRLQSVAESIYEVVDNMTHEVLHENARTYFPFVLTLFVFILFANVLGLIPYSFTVTSHIVITLALALVVFIGATIIGFIRNGFGYLKLFVPSGVPVLLLPLVVVIEIVSYFIRPMSLSIRLVRQHDGGPHDAEGDGGFRCHARRDGGLAAAWRPWWASWALNFSWPPFRPMSSHF